MAIPHTPSQTHPKRQRKEIHQPHLLYLLWKAQTHNLLQGKELFAHYQLY